MKKFLAAVMTSLFMLAVSLQALAAPSIVGSIDYGQVSADRGNVWIHPYDPEDYPEDIRQLVEQVNNSGTGTSVADSFGDLVDLSQIPLYNEDSELERIAPDLPPIMYYLSPMMEIEFDTEVTEESTVSVTFTVNNMTPDMDVYVLYYCPEHGWELLRAERLSDNQVRATFHAGTSLMALVYINNGIQVEPEGTSPQTGESSMPMIAGIAAAAFVLFGLYAARKSRKAA